MSRRLLAGSRMSVPPPAVVPAGAVVSIATGGEVAAVPFGRADATAFGAPNLVISNSIMADSIVDMIGVNTHFSFTDTVYHTSYSDVRAILADSGIRHIRDNPGGEARYTDLYDSFGIRTLLINWAMPDDYNNAKSIGDALEAVESLNEQDPQWATLCPFQTDMWDTYRADSSMDAIPILGPSMMNAFLGPDFAAACSNVSTRMNAGNTHDYSGTAPESAWGGGYGANTLQQNLDAVRAYSGAGSTVWATENGYDMAANLYTSSSQLGAAKYLPRQVFMHWKLATGSAAGAPLPRIYFYELVSTLGLDFGLYSASLVQRQQFTALKSLISILSDPGVSFNTGRLDVSFSGNMTNIYWELMQKRTGVFYLAIWQGIVVTRNDMDGANVNVGGTTDLTNATRAITVDFGALASTVNTYLPSTNATTAVDTYTSVSSVQLDVPDHVMIVEIAL